MSIVFAQGLNSLKEDLITYKVNWVSSDMGKYSAINPLTSKPAKTYYFTLTPDDFTRQWGTPGSQWVK